MKKLLAVITLTAALMLSGCEGRIREGEIYEKEFKPKHTVVVMHTMVHSNGKSTYTTTVPITYRYPDRWCVRIKTLNPDENGKYKAAEYYVTESVYEECEVGDIFIYDRDRDYDSEPLEKEK